MGLIEQRSLEPSLLRHTIIAMAFEILENERNSQPL
jgi:hypothetical protein